jgi:hypothetical protein
MNSAQAHKLLNVQMEPCVCRIPCLSYIYALNCSIPTHTDTCGTDTCGTDTCGTCGTNRFKQVDACTHNYDVRTYMQACKDRVYDWYDVLSGIYQYLCMHMNVFESKIQVWGECNTYATCMVMIKYWNVHVCICVCVWHVCVAFSAHVCVFPFW